MNYVPAELCEVLPGQPFRGKLTDEHTAAMIVHACKPPNVNATSIVDKGLSVLGFRDTANPLPSFGISIGTEMTVVPGRILSAPRVMYATKTQIVDSKASWNLREVKFSQGATLHSWAVLLIQDGNRMHEFQGPDDGALKETVQGFVTMCRTSGINVTTAEPTYITAKIPRKTNEDPTRKAAISKIRVAIESVNPRPTFILVVLSNSDKHIYSGLKHLCDVHLDIHTVSVQVEKFRKKKNQLQYFANVALKVNMKLGGVNHGLDEESMRWLKEEPTILVGMDVTHPGPGSSSGTPSIAAVVASTNDTFAQYPASLRIQKSKQEV